jgi:hypothetical protein
MGGGYGQNVFVAPLFPSLALMMAMVAWLAGSKQHRTVILMAVIGGPSLWVLFDQVLRVRMPAGIWGA